MRIGLRRGAAPIAQRAIRHLQGHVLRFDAAAPAPFEAAAGLRLLLVFGLLELLLGPRLSLLGLFGAPIPPPWIRIPLLLGLASLLVLRFARVRPEHIGLRVLKDWSVTERSYLVQTFVLANVVFGLLFADRLRFVAADRGVWWTALLLVGTNLLWGFYQELVYRGILQTALVRRWGAVAGILVSNLLFTFGPLHFYHFSRGAGHVWPMFAGIFAIGLFFGILFRRSNNLVIVGLFHGLGNAYIEGIGTLGR